MGGKYIPMKFRSDATDELRQQFKQLLTAVPSRCDHVQRICPTKACVESWALDHRLFLRRNTTGREFIRVMQLSDQQVNQLADDIFPHNRSL